MIRDFYPFLQDLRYLWRKIVFRDKRTSDVNTLARTLEGISGQRRVNREIVFGFSIFLVFLYSAGFQYELHNFEGKRLSRVISFDVRIVLTGRGLFARSISFFFVRSLKAHRSASDSSFHTLFPGCNNEPESHVPINLRTNFEQALLHFIFARHESTGRAIHLS